MNPARIMYDMLWSASRGSTLELSLNPSLFTISTGTPNFSALFITCALLLLHTTRATHTVSEFSKYLIMFSQFVPLPDANMAMFFIFGKCYYDYIMLGLAGQPS